MFKLIKQIFVDCIYFIQLIHKFVIYVRIVMDVFSYSRHVREQVSEVSRTFQMAVYEVGGGIVK